MLTFLAILWLCVFVFMLPTLFAFAARLGLGVILLAFGALILSIVLAVPALVLTGLVVFIEYLIGVFSAS